MPDYLAAVNWPYVGFLAAIAFVASLIGHLVSFRSRLFGAILAGILFLAIYILIYHYPHGLFVPPSQLPTKL